MQLRPIAWAAAVAATCLLAACEAPKGAAEMKAEATANEASAANAASAVAADAPVTRESPIWFEPEAVSSCAKDFVGTVHWNASSFPGVQTAQLTLPGADGVEGVFALSANVGEKETGPWMRGGMEVVLRDGETKRELHRARLPSLPCQE